MYDTTQFSNNDVEFACTSQIHRIDQFKLKTLGFPFYFLLRFDLRTKFANPAHPVTSECIDVLYMSSVSDSVRLADQ